ncbi:MAG TPA: class I SAM-dependent methyltransferase [Microlunatus sp.]|nr:class I SAM-dependent methyltransferase [Microlunatus sp.]
MSERDRFDAAYDGTPPWDIGRPQPVFQTLADSGSLRGRVLDAGCGTGEHTLLAAANGLDATGVDSSPKAIALARKKAAARQLPVRFLLVDALALDGLNERFHTVLDSGLFHVFDDAQRPRYVAALHAVLVPGGSLFLMCFSERQPGTIGPRRVTRAEIEASFADGWKIDSIEPAQFALTEQFAPTFGGAAADAWLATITRL